MKKNTITSLIAFAILLVTGVLFRVFAPEEQAHGLTQQGEQPFLSVIDEEQDEENLPTGGYAGDRETANQAVHRLDALKKRMADDGVDFTAMMKKLEARLLESPDGKLSEKDMLGVIPPEYAEEFKDTINDMYYPGTTNTKETRP